jgi:serine/threonine-protein kinase
MLTSGTTFAGYTILERLTRGGMADIYVAQDAQGHQFVLRMLLPTLRWRWKAIRRFRWGCNVLAKLGHPNVIRLFEQGKLKGRRYAIIEYVTGGNLKERILRNDPLLVAERRKLLIGMADGLAHVHERGFLHLDFKPENVLLTANMEPKITDFDLSLPRPQKPQKASQLSGTFMYLAPEQIFGQPVDERADIFAFGITAYEMLTNRKPISGDTRADLVQKYAQFNTHLKPLRTIVPSIPAPIERIVLKCLEKDVNRRYPSMGLVVRDLQQS